MSWLSTFLHSRSVISMGDFPILKKTFPAQQRLLEFSISPIKNHSASRSRCETAEIRGIQKRRWTVLSRNPQKADVFVEDV